MSPFKALQIIFLTGATVTGLPYVIGAAANDFPTKPIRLVVPLPPGSGGDIAGRLLAQGMSVAMSQSVYVDNRTGALGTVGSASVARLPPDGYTLLLGNAGSHGAAVTMFPTLAYDPVEDFTPLTLVNRNYLAIMVKADLGVASLQEFIGLARANPGKLTYGTPGTGSQHWLAGETLKKMSGIDIVHVPFQGGGGAMSSLLGGHISAVVGSLSTGVELAASGKVRILAVTHESRVAELPDIPAVAETYPGFSFAGWWALFGPKGIPGPIVQTLNDGARKALTAPDLVTSFERNGFVPKGSTPDELRTIVRAELARWKTSGFAAKP
jgi:tripartite-type tricarboxylate transporter receptor subunit TctC